jgi:hypothetical protein
MRLYRVYAMCGSIESARGAFNASVAAHPDKIWYIRQKTRVLQRYPKDKNG